MVGGVGCEEICLAWLVWPGLLGQFVWGLEAWLVILDLVDKISCGFL